MTFTLYNSNSTLLMMDDEGESDKDSTIVRRATIMQNGQIVPTNSIFPEAENLIITERLLRGDYQVELELLDGTFTKKSNSSLFSLHDVVNEIVKLVSETLPMIYKLDDRTTMALPVVRKRENILPAPPIRNAVFTQDNRCVSTWSILPGVERIVIDKEFSDYYVSLEYIDKSRADAPDRFECRSLDEAADYIIDLVTRALKSQK